MDPMERVVAATDTSFAFMLAAHARGFRILHVHPWDVTFAGHVLFRGQEIVPLEGAEVYRSIRALQVAAEDCAGCFIRTDPPFNEDYLNVTWLLSLAEAAGLRVINSPRGLREANEHLYSLHFPQLCPRTLVTSERAAIRRFVGETKRAILKPIDGHAGFGVFLLREGDSNLGAIIDVLTAEGRRPAMVQEYLPSDGDVRVFLIDGRVRGGVRRIAPAGDHRGNVHIGGGIAPYDVGAEARHVEAVMGDRLRRDGLYFVGIDMIGDKLIEVNVTSPTLLCELKRLGGPDLADVVIGSIGA
jgi:glutathione synthase